MLPLLHIAFLKAHCNLFRAETYFLMRTVKIYWVLQKWQNNEITWLFFTISCNNVKIALSNSNLIPVRYISNLTSPFQLDSSKSHRGTRVMQLLLPYNTDIQVDGCLICKPFSKKTETKLHATKYVLINSLSTTFFFFPQMIIIVKRKGEER